MSGFQKYHTSAAQDGLDLGAKQLAEESSYEAFCVCEYIWLDKDGVTRSKTKTVTHKPTNADDCGIWMYNGHACGQANQNESDVYLVPRAIFPDPIRGDPHTMVLCEAVTPIMEPADGNNRAFALEYLEKYADAEPWFAFEQEYVLACRGKLGGANGKPAGYHADGSRPKNNSLSYCGAGGHVVPKMMRAMMDEHYAACMKAGIKIAGTNLEASPGQGEYQIGPCKGIEIGDHLIIARHLMNVVAEKYDFAVSLHPKPVTGDYDPSGCHINISTKQTRAEDGMHHIERICRALGRHAKEHLAVYGHKNEVRLTGQNQTCEVGEFSFNTGNRGTSVRIPRQVAMTGHGYLEDRRPAANADPYSVVGVMMKTAGDALYSKGAVIDERPKAEVKPAVMPKETGKGAKEV